MTPTPTRILAVADASETQIALRTAAALAERHGAALEVMACVEPPRDLAILARLAGADPDRLLEEAVTRTRAAIAGRLSHGDGAAPLSVVVGKAYFEIIRHVARTGCDFVVKAAEPLTGVNRLLFASTDQHLLRKCPCPVWLQTPPGSAAPRRVMAAVDLDLGDADEPETLQDLNRRVVETACQIAARDGGEVHVLHAWEALGAGMVWAFSSDVDARESADRYIDEVQSSRQDAMTRLLAEVEAAHPGGPRLVPQLARGAPEEALHREGVAIGAEVVVMGTVARTGLSGVFIGNTAENIINSLDCPVLAVKPAGFVSPLLSQ